MSITEKLKKAKLIDFKKILLTFHQDNIPFNSVRLTNGDGKKFVINILNASNEWLLELEEEYLLGDDYYVCVDEEQIVVDIDEDLVRGARFDELYYYSGEDLGIEYSNQLTKVAIWSPLATKGRILLSEKWNLEPTSIIPLIRTEKGVWRQRLEGDYDEVFYQFEFLIHSKWVKVNDPYAKLMTVNGKKGMIGNPAKVNPKTWPVACQPSFMNEVIIYELHIRDFTIGRNNGIKAKGQYLGFSEKGTHSVNGQVTGIDYLKKLQVSHIEILPLHDFGSVDETNWKEQYNWGYDPIYFFALEGSYSSNPYNSYQRVKELKEMIAQLHEHNMKVILDVVFNHVYIREQSDLEKMVPGYYFRAHSNGQISNGTGVGNDLATERLMVRKLVIDCIKYWLKEFDVDGFRFDLMGIIDLDTMHQVVATCQEIKNDVVLLGEGWDLPTAYPTSKRTTLHSAKKITSIGFFDDQFRDLIKGSTFQYKAQGFVHGIGIEMEKLKDGISGSPSLFSQPSQAIHYIEAHDNHTLWDKLTLSTPSNDDIRYKQHRLATTIILLAQGIPFLHGGQEFFRTKYGDANSYNSGDLVNQFDWERRETYQDNVDFISGIISIRKHHQAFHLSSYQLITKHLRWLECGNGCVAYILEGVHEFGPWNDIMVIHNAKDKVEKLAINFGNWQVLVDELTASLIPLYTLKEEEIIVQPISTMVCIRA
ncbi:pullulanase [Bacillus sp. TS-2]|nr:pullulanase [Bacillus sp. TS-2]